MSGLSLNHFSASSTEFAADLHRNTGIAIAGKTIALPLFA
jgi:hypothetical protein